MPFVNITGPILSNTVYCGGELVAKVVRLAKELGRGIATSEEARRILNLKPRI